MERQEYGAGSTYVAGVMTSRPCATTGRGPSGTTGSRTCAPSFYQLLYEKPIYPKNLYLDRAPMKHAEYREKVIKRQIKLMHDRGVWARPAR